MSFWTMLEPGHPVATFGSGTARRGPRCETTTGARGSRGSRASCAAWPGGGAPNVMGKWMNPKDFLENFMKNEL